jgi:hypothetical protein
MSSWNDYSLLKLQMALWAIVVLAGVIAVAKIRLLGILGSAVDPLRIVVPGDLLAAMGISAFTTAATPAILALKASQAPDPARIPVAQQRVANATGGHPTDVTNDGKAIGRATANMASWVDIVTGDEAAKAGTVDLSKVQQLLITFLLLGSYVGMLAVMFGTATRTEGGAIAGLPPLRQGFVEVLAVSHAGYPVYKAASK